MRSAPASYIGAQDNDSSSRGSQDDHDRKHLRRRERTAAVAIPCHRVVKADGSLSGYRWGARRKKALLAREGVPMDPTTFEAKL